MLDDKLTYLDVFESLIVPLPILVKQHDDLIEITLEQIDKYSIRLLEKITVLKIIPSDVPPLLQNNTCYHPYGFHEEKFQLFDHFSRLWPIFLTYHNYKRCSNDGR